jgi:hypothetical protein
LNPNSKTYCTYIVPGNDNEVTGLAVTGTWPHSSVWFVESSVTRDHPSLDSFNPATVGDGCPGTVNEVYSLAGALMSDSWPANDFPAQIAPDTASPALWVTDFLGSEIDRVDTGTGAITRYDVPVRDHYSALGSGPWQIVTDQGFVYAINYADSTLVRVNKANGQLDVVPIPLTSDVEQGYGLALSGGTLYFTLSDDRQPSFGAASTFGYVSVAAWEAASSSCLPHGADCAPAPQIAGVYSGVDALGSDFRGIAVGPSDRVAVADRHDIVLFTP